jgi:hypothetical protein
MTRTRVIWSMIAAATLAVVAGGTARADAPSPGTGCMGSNATAQDGQGRTMWCEPPGPEYNVLIWQYNEPTQAPSPGDSCPTLHASTLDADGRTLWCNPTMTGNHSLVWQYGGPS